MLRRTPNGTQPRSPGSAHLGAPALLLALVSACVVQPAPPPPAPPVVEPAPPPPAPRVVVLEDGGFVDIRPGLEPGFSHCCGNSEYMLEIDCSVNRMRCYALERGRWKHTYGRHCKTELGEHCYLHACDNVCEASATFGTR